MSDGKTHDFLYLLVLPSKCYCKNKEHVCLIARLGSASTGVCKSEIKILCTVRRPIYNGVNKNKYAIVDID